MKSRDLVWTSTARADFFEAHTYIARENPAAADRFFFDMYLKVETVARNGLTGTDRSELGGGVRSFSYRERIIFFNVSETELTVLRVAHGHQDISPDYFKTDEN